VVVAAEAVLARGTSVSPIDVLVAIGWLPQSTVDGWRRGRVGCLEQVARIHPDKLAAVVEHLRGWAADKGLLPSEVAYLAATRDRRPCGSPPAVTRPPSAPGARTGCDQACPRRRRSA